MQTHEPEIWLMRDALLTKKGEEQVFIKASELVGQGLNFDRIFCSPLARAVYTAQIIGDLTKSKEAPYILPTLTESTELISDMCRRADMALRQILMLSKPGHRVLVVSHGYTLKAIEATWYGENWKEVCARGKFGNGEVRRLTPRARVIGITPTKT